MTSADDFVSTGAIQIARVSPGLFAANANGQGVAAAVALRVKADGSQSYEPIARFDSAQNKVVPISIDLEPESDQVFLILFGTGARFVSSQSAVSVTIGGTDAQVTYTGPQPAYAGLDQINVRLPRSLAGRGEVEVAMTAERLAATWVRINLRWRSPFHSGTTL